MSDPTPSRRFALLVVLMVTIGIISCTSYKATKVRKNLCDSGNGSPNRPLICVDEKTMLTSPRETHVFDVEPESDNKPSNRPVTIHWLSRQGGNLGVEFADKSCVERVRCDGAGHCWTRVKRLREGERVTVGGREKPGRRCEYTLNLDGRASDPPVIVNPCCWFKDPDIVNQLEGSFFLP